MKKVGGVLPFIPLKLMDIYAIAPEKKSKCLKIFPEQIQIYSTKTCRTYKANKIREDWRFVFLL